MFQYLTSEEGQSGRSGATARIRRRVSSAGRLRYGAANQRADSGGSSIEIELSN